MSQRINYGNLTLDMAGLSVDRRPTKYPGRYLRELKTQKLSFRQKGRVFLKDEVSILFMGTPEFACPALDKLILNEKVIGVVTQPDRFAGRGKILKSPAVKDLALKKNIPVYQPEKVNALDFISKIKGIKFDLIVVVAFGEILSPSILSIPNFFSINLHASLLPSYRGPAPIAWAIIKGEKETGITIQRIRPQVDRGEIILQEKLPIDAYDTARTLSSKLSRAGANTLLQAIKLIKEGRTQFRPQGEESSYAPKIRKEQGRINWNSSAETIHNLVRGLNPYPGAFTFIFLRGALQKIKLWKTKPVKDLKEHGRLVSGTIEKIKKNLGFLVRTGDGWLLIEELQLPNRSRIKGYDFIKGYHIKEGTNLVCPNESNKLN